MLLTMRFAFSILILSLFLSACSSTNNEAITQVKFKDIDPTFMEDRDFKRINEFLTGVEEHGDRTVVRSQAKIRAGFYFAIHLDTKINRLPRGARLFAEIYSPLSTEVQTFDLTLPAERGSSREILFGLTGSDWPYGDNRAPAAWRFTIKDANDKSLGSAQSYLWN